MGTKTPQKILDELSNTEFGGDFEDTLDIACHPDTDIDRITILVKSAMETYAKQQTESKQAAMDKLEAEIKYLKEYVKDLEKYTTKIQN